MSDKALLGLICAVLALQACATAPGEPQQLFRDPAIDLVAQGILFYQAAEYSRAIEVFQEANSLPMGSSLRSESHWMLARSYEAAGMQNEAATEYRFFLSNFPSNGHIPEAQSRLELLEKEARSSRWVYGERWVSSDEAPEAIRGRFDDLQGRGINTLIIPILGDQGAFFSSDRAPVVSDRLNRIVPIAHLKGMMVLGEVFPQKMTWITRLHPEWEDQTFRVEEGRISGSHRPDLLRSDVWRYLTGLLRDAEKTGIDGFLLNFSVGRYEGWNPLWTAEFEKNFSERITPGQLAQIKDGEYPPVFWRWAGWRARRVAQWVSETKQALPEARWGVTIFEEALKAPQEGLFNRGQDLLALRSLSFDYYVIRLPSIQSRALDGRLRALLPNSHQRLLAVSSSAPKPESIERGNWGGIVLMDP